MRIAFYAGQCLPFHAYSLEERPLGGTETGVIYVAEILSKRGFDVTVYSSYRNPPPSEPKYLFHDQLASSGNFDAIFVVQYWHPLVSELPTKRIFFWTGDAFDQYANFGIGDKRIATKIERFLAVSNWQRDTICHYSGFPPEKCFMVGNGVNLSLFKGSEVRAQKRLIYSSAPYRGLALTPPLIEQLRQGHPDLEFHVFAGLSIYDTDKPFLGPELAQYKAVAQQLKRIPGCFIHGNTVQRVLAREFMKSSILFYPNTFPETSCITAIEAQAAGCAILSSSFAALPETVGDAGILIAGTPGSSDYTTRFIAAASQLLTDSELWQRYSQAGIMRSKKMTWDLVADRFEVLLRNKGGCQLDSSLTQ